MRLLEGIAGFLKPFFFCERQEATLSDHLKISPKTVQGISISDFDRVTDDNLSHNLW